MKDPLFLGLTRPTMIAGLTVEAYLAILMLTCLIVINVGILYAVVVYLISHFICYWICRKDPALFRILALYFKTKLSANSGSFFKTASFSTLKNTREIKEC